jgi:hypothetical protein
MVYSPFVCPAIIRPGGAVPGDGLLPVLALNQKTVHLLPSTHRNDERLAPLSVSLSAQAHIRLFSCDTIQPDTRQT